MVSKRILEAFSPGVEKGLTYHTGAGRTIPVRGKESQGSHKRKEQEKKEEKQSILVAVMSMFVVLLLAGGRGELAVVFVLSSLPLRDVGENQAYILVL